MPNDAKLGLVVGVGLVIAIAILFFRKDSPAADPAAATSVKQTPAPPNTPATTARGRPVPGHTGIRTTAPTTAEGRCHTVREGETLFSLARQYYGDGQRSDFLYQVNRSRLTSPEALEPGTVLVIPDLPDEGEKAGEP
jgi:nucleoid-associated protein YgaU